MKKRLLTYITIAILIAGTVVQGSSYATNDNDYEDLTLDRKPAASTAYKDTSWFDYENPQKNYKISTESQLIGLSSLINEVQTDKWKPNKYEDFENVTFFLTEDIKLTQKWEPIGTDDHVTFKGTFDGQGHSISGLNVEETGNNAGFFGHLNGTVKNLSLAGHVQTTGGNCGAFAGYIGDGGLIYNCLSEVKVTAGAKTGGIAGYNSSGEIRKCINKGNVKGTIKVGGIAGENWSRLIKSGNRGSVSSSGRGVSTYGTGGVAGRSVSENALINQCYNTGKIKSHTEATGGIVGYTNASGSIIKNSYNTGTIQVDNPKALQRISASKGYAGGIAGTVGIKGVEIKNCYNAGPINNTDISGGIIGLYNNESNLSKDIYINNNYFVKNNVKYGIGQDSHRRGSNLSKGTILISAEALKGESSNIGPHYAADKSGAYGNSGYAVLSWQEKLPDNEIEYISQLHRSTQKKYEKYISEHSGSNAIGYRILIFFNLKEYTSNTIGEFNDK